MASTLIYEVECRLDPDIVAEYDGWLPGHVQQVLACAGFLDASIESPEASAGEPQRRLVRYRVASAGALDQYLENEATRLRAETAQRFGERVRCGRRVLRPRQTLSPPGRDLPSCLNCGATVAGAYCAQCGQSAATHVLSMREVLGDVTHSLFHLDSRAWRTLRLLVVRPGELTREFVAGRHQRYLPPFRLYLAISILYFALSALLPGSGLLGDDAKGNTIHAPGAVEIPGELKRELEAEGVPRAGIDGVATRGERCELSISESPTFDELEQSLNRACEQIRADGGKRFAERFAAMAPKLMFLFLPLIAAVALLFYWRPRRLYAEHLVLFLHNHAFTFLWLGVIEIAGAIGDAAAPIAGALEFVSFLVFLYLPYYVYRSMRVVYGEGRVETTFKLLALATIYFVLLGVTMLAGFIYTLLGLP